MKMNKIMAVVLVCAIMCSAACNRTTEQKSVAKTTNVTTRATTTTAMYLSASQRDNLIKESIVEPLKEKVERSYDNAKIDKVRISSFSETSRTSEKLKGTVYGYFYWGHIRCDNRKEFQVNVTISCDKYGRYECEYGYFNLLY